MNWLSTRITRRCLLGISSEFWDPEGVTERSRTRCALVLHCPNDEWRFAIHGDGGILGGELLSLTGRSAPLLGGTANTPASSKGGRH